MTFFRETWRLLSCAAAATIAGSAFIAAPVQAATVNFGNCTSGGNYQSVAVDGNGNFTISCTATAGPGTVGFSPSTYTAAYNQVVAVNVSRTGGTSGVVGANLSISGGCTLSANTVSFPDGSSATQSVNVTAPGSATMCQVNLAVTGGAVQGTSGATVNVVDPNSAGTFGFTVSNSGPGLNQNFSFQITRAGGSSGTYDIPYTAVPTGLTGASVTPGSPIRFNDGETTKTLTLATGSTAGTMLITFGTPIPIAPTTAATTAGGAITITVVGGGSCGTPASNVVILGDMPTGEGAHTLINLSPGQIGSVKLPSLPGGVLGASITQTQTQGTGDITVMEIGISPCPGDLTWGAKTLDGGPGTNQQIAGGTYQPCYTKSSFITNVSVAWHLTVSGHYAYCYAPVVTGPWYVNVRYTMPGGCTYGQGNCGASFQWNRR